MEELKKIYDAIERVESGEYSFPKDYDDPRCQNPELCKECGGECCKRCGCMFSPDDFDDLSYEAMKKEIGKGHITLELIDGEYICRPGFYYALRMRNINAPIVEDCFGYRGRSPCILLGEKGCKLPYSKRPSEGRLMWPIKIGGTYLCESNYDARDATLEWVKYQPLLRNLANYFRGIDIPCSIR